MEKTLILYHNTTSYYFENICSDQCSIHAVFRSEKWMTQKILRVFRKLSSSLTRIYYGDWYANLDSYSKVIVFDTPFSYDKKLLINISKKSKSIKKFFYFWNIVKNQTMLHEIQQACDQAGFVLYSYNGIDCEKYILKYNPSMYDINLKLHPKEIEYDTFFLGFLKDKVDKLLNINELFRQAALTPRLIIVDLCDEKLHYSCFEYRQREVAYKEYLEMLNESRSILDVAQSGQDGLSLRVMEAIFLNKKLITTNKAVKDTIFYDENNILIFDDTTTPEDIRHFFDKPFKKYSQEIRDYYSIEQWVERFV